MLMQKLQDYGITPFLVPEVATMVFSCGINIKKIAGDPKLYFEFQRQMLLTQLMLEDQMKKFARIQPGQNKVLIADRGAMDIKSFMDPFVFDAMIEDMGFDETSLRDKRNDAVFHLVTAAEGAESSYGYNNPVRYETPAEARLTDARTLNAWLGHEHLTIISNTKLAGKRKRRITFKEKMDLLLQAVCKTLGIPVPLEIERSFLLSKATLVKDITVPFVASDINQVYLLPKESNIIRRIRKRQQIDGGGTVYTYTEKQDIKPGVRQEVERIISAREFLILLSEKDPEKQPIVKKRYNFSWEDQYFQLDVISSPMNLVRLEVELTKEQQELRLPPFLQVVKEVTDDKRYSNISIASDQCPGYD